MPRFMPRLQPSLRVLMSLLCCIAFSGLAEGREVHKVTTSSGETFFPLRMSMYVRCSGEVPRTLRDVTRVSGETEFQGSWDELPDFFMDWDKERGAYILLSNEDKPEEREEIGYVELERPYRASGCRHHLKLEMLGGITRRVLVSRIEWPVLVHRK